MDHLSLKLSLKKLKLQIYKKNEANLLLSD